MNIKPLISALWRNRVGPGLVAFEIAISLAVIVNALYFVVENREKLSAPPGMDVDNIFWVLSEGYAEDFDYPETVRADLQLLNSLPSVVAATTINKLPISGSGSIGRYSATPGQTGKREFASVYMVTERGTEALGVRLSEGSAFDAGVIAGPKMDYAEAMATTGPEVILTQALARKLFPNGQVVGQLIYDAGFDRALRVTGVIDHMQGADPYRPGNDQVVLLPSVSSGPSVMYWIRTKPGRRDELMGTLPSMLEGSQPGRTITKVESFSTTAARTYAIDGNTNIFATVIATLVTIVASLGIFGLATFSVTTRTRQIGIRRALGASKLDILKYFLLENWLITTGGVVFGCVLALGIGVKLSLMLQAPRLPLYYLVVGALVMWALGLCATLVPARRAAAVSPAIATRSI